MKAARVHGFGPPAVIAVEDLPTPEPARNELLVRVDAAGVGPWDALVRSGKSVVPQPLPLTLGSDLSGTVVAVGGGVRDFRVGEAVYGVTNRRFTGAYAEYAVATATMMARKPASLTQVEAASVPVVAVTALQMLFDHVRVEPGQRVLIHGAGGNVGSYAVQLARAAGLHVIATERTRNVDYVKGLGADEVIDMDAARFEHRIERVDVVIDTVGGDVQSRSLSVVKPGGVLISSACKPSKADAGEAERRGVRATFILVDVTTEALTRIAERIDEGALKVRVGTVMPLSEARLAHDMLEGTLPRAPGKIVLSMHDDGAHSD